MKLLLIFFTTFIWSNFSQAHPPGLINEAACSKNLIQNQLKEICIGTIGTGSLHSQNVPEVIWSLFFKTQNNKEITTTAMAIFPRSSAKGLSLSSVKSKLKQDGGFFKFAEFQTFELEHDLEEISSISGTSSEGHEFKIEFSVGVKNRDATSVILRLALGPESGYVFREHHPIDQC